MGVLLCTVKNAASALTQIIVLRVGAKMFEHRNLTICAF